MAKSPQPFTFSRDSELLLPKKEKAYPISISEWNYLKGQVEQINTDNGLWGDLGWALIGAGVTCFVAVFTAETPLSLVIFITLAAVGIICGALCLYFALQGKKTREEAKSSVLGYMNHISARFAPHDNTTAI